MKKTDEIKNRVTGLLGARSGRAMTATEIADALKVSGKQRKHFQKVLNEMVVEGTIVVIRNKRYSLGASADLVAGVLTVARSGNGYVNSAEDTDDLFVPSGNMGVALPGDRVLARIEQPRPGRRGAERTRPEGRIIRILERSRRDIVGTLRSTGRFYYVLPLSPAYAQDFYVDDPREAQLNDRVVARFANWENKHVNPEAEIVEVLGPADSPAVDTVSIMRQYNLPEEFPEEGMREAERASEAMDRPGKRLNLRNQLILTIDPERARDFDDALSLKRDSDGNRVLGVHIADVSHFIRPGSAMDTEAALRGNSVYLPDKVIPMLPEQLSNGICSLRPGEDRLAFSAFLTFNSSGKMIERSFAKTVIRSRHRLTYEQAMSYLDAGARDKRQDAGKKNLPPDAMALLRDLNKLAQQLRKKRFARNALDLDMPEIEVFFGDDGRIVDVRTAVNDESHQLVEECMLAANEAVAAELTDRGFPLIHRYHAPPSESRIEDLTIELEQMGFHPGDLKNRRNLSNFLKTVQDDPLAYDVQLAVLRSMNRAVYSATLSGHFGLAKKMYTHFTSPIRRYPDLAVHRQLAAALSGRSGSRYDKKSLASISESCSQTEQTAEEAERELLEIKKCRFLADQLESGDLQVYKAVVVKVMNFGLFVDVPRLRVQGLVHVSSISDRFVRFSQRSAALRDGREVYKAGRRINVSVSKVDFDKRRIDFVLV